MQKGPSDSNGRFELDELAPGGYEVFVESDAGVASPLAIEVPHEGDLKIELRPAATLLGQVSDAEGLGVSGVRLGLELSGRERGSRAGIYEGYSGREGRFELEQLSSGVYQLTAEHPVLGSLTRQIVLEEGGRLELDLAFEAGPAPEDLRVSGRVVDTHGTGIDGARVALGAERQGRAPHTWSFGGGRFEVSATQAGVSWLEVYHQDYAEYRGATFQVGKGPVKDLVVELDRGASATGRIVGLPPELAFTDQLEAREVKKYFVGSASRGGDARTRVGSVSRDGSYRVPNLAPGDGASRRGCRAPAGRLPGRSTSALPVGASRSIWCSPRSSV